MIIIFSLNLGVEFSANFDLEELWGFNHTTEDSVIGWTQVLSYMNLELLKFLRRDFVQYNLTDNESRREVMILTDLEQNCNLNL